LRRVTSAIRLLWTVDTTAAVITVATPHTASADGIEVNWATAPANTGPSPCMVIIPVLSRANP